MSLPESEKALDSQEQLALEARKTRASKNRVRGWHHHAIRTKDMTATRAFYEGILGMPLVGTWVEPFDVIKQKPSNYVHCFFELGDGSALAFFQFEEGVREDPMPMPGDPYEHHVALGVDSIDDVKAIKAQLDAANVSSFIVDHGYCYSCYTQDPNGMMVEFSAIVPNGYSILEASAKTADADLKHWLEGVREANNRWRGHTE
jgi:catechol 2,3-dioxygenase-like lactoylglutathione lyase family enzyme